MRGSIIVVDCGQQNDNSGCVGEHEVAERTAEEGKTTTQEAKITARETKTEEETITSNSS